VGKYTCRTDDCEQWHPAGLRLPRPTLPLLNEAGPFYCMICIDSPLRCHGLTYHRQAIRLADIENAKSCAYAVSFERVVADEMCEVVMSRPASSAGDRGPNYAIA